MHQEKTFEFHGNLKKEEKPAILSEIILCPETILRQTAELSHSVEIGLAGLKNNSDKMTP